MDSNQVKRFINIFSGLEEAHGYYNVDEATTQGQKRLGDRGTINEHVTTDLWEKHLQGERGLGICPINRDNVCRWGCIDIDKYDLNHREVISRITSDQLPLMVARSKSGGAHVFVFFKEPVAAKEVQDKLKEMASILGVGGSEIFPKQTHILADKGDAGSWLNLPYFDADKTVRYAFDSKGEQLSLAEFLDLAEYMQQSRKDFLSASAQAEENTEFKGAPICLERLTQVGVPEGTRNNAMVAFCTFAKKKYPDSWRLKVEEWNRSVLERPLESDELATLIKGQERKDYQYRCSELPICNYCNRTQCMTREYGIGKSGAIPNFGALTKLNTDPPTWFLDVDGGGRLQLETEELQNQTRFQKKCMEQLNLMPPKLREGDWQLIIQGLMESLVILEAPYEASRAGYFEELLFNYFLSSDQVLARTRDEVLIGKPWVDTDNKVALFRISDLMNYLEKRKFKEYTRHQVASRLKSLGAQHKSVTVKNRSVRLYELSIEPDEPIKLEVPDMPQVPI